MSHRGLTFIEVLIASSILVIVSMAALTALVVSSRIARDAIDDVIAMEMANRQIELIRAAADYNILGLADDGSQISGFVDDDVIVYDPQFPDNGPTFTISYQWLGFGMVSSATASSITFNDPNAGDVNYTGNRLILRRGAGEGQIVKITNHTWTTNSSTFAISADLNEYGEDDFAVIPNSTTYFEVDGGKSLRMTLAWQTKSGSNRNLTRTLFIPHPL